MLREKIKALGEIVLRVNNMETEIDFYQNIIGLELIKKGGDYTFFKIADGYGGHHQTLALFDVTIPTAFGKVRENVEINNTSLHHLALEIDKNDYEVILKQLQEKGIEVKTQIFEWVQWKSIFIKDPEMNIVEFVCFDPDIKE